MGLRPHLPFWQTARFQLSLKQPLVMGIVNVTPDSFSDGGTFHHVDDALKHAHQLINEGADLLDIGGESSRPGASALHADEEWSRIEPVLQQLIAMQHPISVDTYHPINMQRALDMGVDIINDIWGFRQTGAIQAVANHSNCGICIMHMHGNPQTMQRNPLQGYAVRTVGQFLNEQIQTALSHGIDPHRILIDPGIGFGKTVAQNFSLLQHQDQLLQLGYPLLVGWSRKSFLGEVTQTSVDQRLVPSVSAMLLAVERGAHVVRVHDVAATVQALRVRAAALQI
ncbi:MAG: dihydropteroate synthase [Limnohabitans sp.]|nr:dihydropteroate synthase [Limnohabitans sp.]